MDPTGSVHKKARGKKLTQTTMILIRGNVFEKMSIARGKMRSKYEEEKIAKFIF